MSHDLKSSTEAFSFSSLDVSPELVEVAKELGFEKMTPIQAKSIPALLAGKDLIGQCKTGSGKTAAFTLPLLEKINLKAKKLQALVLCPTRELCTQVAREIRKLGRKHPGLQVLILSGGQPFYPQLTALEKGVHIVVGTPGRVLDHLSRKTLDLVSVATLVLDEADRMLEMGFQDDMERIFKYVPKTRQTVLFSATFPKTIELLSRSYQKNPVRVTIENEARSENAIRQLYYPVSPETKFNGFLWILQQTNPKAAIVFCNMKASVIELARLLSQAGVSSAGLHGDLEQAERDRVMAKFRNQSTRILVATDVAARGLDIADLDVVFNFDLPAKPEIYVHRIGRTGRAGKKGLSISLVTTREKGKIPAIEKYTGVAMIEKQLAPVENLDVAEFRKKIEQVAEMSTLFIGGGRKDKVRPGDILGALTGETGGLRGKDIGKIEIHDRFSYVAVPKNSAHVVRQRLSDGKIKGRRFRVEMVR